jgi:hypothetical protein
MVTVYPMHRRNNLRRIIIEPMVSTVLSRPLFRFFYFKQTSHATSTDVRLA